MAFFDSLNRIGAIAREQAKQHQDRVDGKRISVVFNNQDTINSATNNFGDLVFSTPTLQQTDFADAAIQSRRRIFGGGESPQWKVVLRTAANALYVGGQTTPQLAIPAPGNPFGFPFVGLIATGTAVNAWSFTVLLADTLQQANPSGNSVIANGLPTNLLFRGGEFWQQAPPGLRIEVNGIDGFLIGTSPASSQQTLFSNSTGTVPTAATPFPNEWGAAFTGTQPAGTNVGSLAFPIEHTTSTESYESGGGTITRQTLADNFMAGYPSTNPSQSPLVGSYSLTDYNHSGNGANSDTTPTETTTETRTSAFSSISDRITGTIAMTTVDGSASQNTFNQLNVRYRGNGQNNTGTTINYVAPGETDTTEATGDRAGFAIEFARTLGTWQLLPGTVVTHDAWESVSEKNSNIQEIPIQPSFSATWAVVSSDVGGSAANFINREFTYLASPDLQYAITERVAQTGNVTYTPGFIGPDAVITRTYNYASPVLNLDQTISEFFWRSPSGVKPINNTEVLSAIANLPDTTFDAVTLPITITVGGFGPILFQAQADYYTQNTVTNYVAELGTPAVPQGGSLLGNPVPNTATVGGGTPNPLWSALIGAEVFLVGKVTSNSCTKAIGTITALSTTDVDPGSGIISRRCSSMQITITQVIQDWEDLTWVDEGPNRWQIGFNHGSIYSLGIIRIANNLPPATDLGWSRQNGKIYLTRALTTGIPINTTDRFRWQAIQWEIDDSGPIVQIKRVHPSLEALCAPLQLTGVTFQDVVNLQLQLGSWP